MNTTKTLNKAQQERQKVMAMLDQADEAVPANPGLDSGARNSGFEELFANSLKEQDFKVGDVVTGTVVEVQSDYVLVDINYKSEGLIPIGEFRIVDGRRDVSPGNTVEVYIDRVENENGMVVLSKEKADMLRAWNDISKIHENGEVI
ncbi:MAG: S1 RNA-binding domain-containing protein [Pseudobdellovibrionaceae bacterium]